MTEPLPAFRGIIGQARAIARLDRAVRVGQLSHAYIFEGPSGVGKRTTAEALAKALVCGGQGCNRCEDCIRLEHGTHPSLVSVAPQGVSLGIDQVREIAHQVILKPAEGEWKVYVVDDADAMTVQAANAFLRTLEEPPPGVIFVLVTSNVHGMLPTIRSRCQEVTFNAIPGRDIVALLRERFGFDADEAELATRVSGGIVGKALALVRGPAMKRRDQVLSVASDLPVLDSFDIMGAAEALAGSVKGDTRQESRAADAAEGAEEFAIDKRHASFIRRTLEQRAKRDVAQRERAAFEGVLSAFDSWFRDVLVVGEGVGELIVNLDRRDAIERCARTMSSQNALDCISAVERTRRMVRQNVNPQLALEAMLLDMQECIPCNVS